MEEKINNIDQAMIKQLRDKQMSGFVLLKNGHVWDAAKRTSDKIDLLLKDGRIEKIGNVEAVPEDANVVSIDNCTVLPGLIDLHVHLREPGQEERETVESGCAAAAAGGFTAVCCMPNTKPVIDNQEVVRFVKEKARDLLVEVYPIGAISKNSIGEELAEIGYMVEAGIVGITDDGLPIQDSSILRRALEYSQMFDIPVIEHAQDIGLTYNGSMNEGYYSTKCGLTGMPTIAEDIIVSRDIQLLEYVGGRLHIQHISSAHSVDLIRMAKDKGLNVTSEATPHHITLTDQCIQTYDPNFKMNPPLRSEDDRIAVIEGLKDGTIDAIATDHAPHVIDDKEGEFDRAAFGVTGLETAVGIYFTELVNKQGFKGIEELVNLCVVNPRKIMNMPVPEIKEGVQADLCVLNQDTRWTVEEETFYSKSSNSCFLDNELVGRVVGVVGKGRYWLRRE